MINLNPSDAEPVNRSACHVGDANMASYPLLMKVACWIPILGIKANDL
jgi:hypothetical protein